MIIEILEKRGFIDAITSEDLRKVCKKPIKLYIGFDPTADSLHLGHLIGIMALSWFQKHGHQPIALLGGATAKIGDPSGKNVERPLLDLKTLSHNAQSIRKQFEACLDFSDPKIKPMILNNDDWLSQYPLLDFLRDVGKHFRLGPMLAKESVKARMASEEGISFTEFTYQVLQGYDFYHLHKEENVQLQMGGSDQWGNITAGIELNRKLSKTPIYGATFPLLTKSDGTKFGKSEGGAVWLSKERTSPYKFYQYLYRVADADVITLLRMLTFVELDEIESYEEGIKNQTAPPNQAQTRLAQEVTRFVHGQEGVDIAERVTAAIAPGSQATLDPEILQEIAKDMPNISVTSKEVLGQKWIDLAILSKLLKSKGEANRLIANGGAYLNNQKVSDKEHIISTTDIIGEKYLLIASGKKNKILITLS